VAWIVAIDPGHGGDDGGAIGPAGTLEKSVNLSLALKCAQYAERMGWTPILTRDSDVALSLSGRAGRRRTRGRVIPKASRWPWRCRTFCS